MLCQRTHLNNPTKRPPNIVGPLQPHCMDVSSVHPCPSIGQHVYQTNYVDSRADLLIEKLIAFIHTAATNSPLALLLSDVTFSENCCCSTECLQPSPAVASASTAQQRLHIRLLCSCNRATAATAVIAGICNCMDILLMELNPPQ
eukprot:GHRR01005111.1.p1 GENE.GHRR01005111.1~~GHRR01005111.1.p1  ORF type:complete len:145 (+),score=29.20 GHRR01005111.1:1429-1863(+)